MKKIQLSVFMLLCSISLLSQAQEPPVEDTNQLAMLESDDPQLAKNKRLVFDFFRVVYEGGHMDRAPEFMAEGYIQHNPNVQSGRDSFVKVFSEVRTPSPISDRIKVRLINIIAEGDTVMVSFVRKVADRENPDYTYDMTWYDVFRIEDGLIAEHWDPSETWGTKGLPPGAEFPFFQ